MTTLGANLASAQLRTERASVHRQLANGTRTLEDVLTDPPAAIGGVPLFALITWRRGWGPDRLRKLGAQAIRDQINLAMPVSLASLRTRGWLIEWDRSTGRYAGSADRA